MCSTIIFGHSETKLLAANYDYAQDHGLVALNLRGTKKNNGAQHSEMRVEWAVKYGSITFNQFSLEFPVSGMNEMGLCIALMWHEEGDFGDDARYKRINELQWIQYQLDNYSSVQQLVDGLDDIRPERGPLPLHFSVLDAHGSHALIEFFNNDLNIQLNAELPILTNNSYEACLRAAVESSDSTPDSSRGRFARLYSLYKNSDPSVSSTFGFELLDSVNASSLNEQGFPWNQGYGNTVTAWSAIFSPKDKTINFKSSQNSSIRTLQLEQLKFDPEGEYQLMDVHAGNGGVSSRYLEPYTRQKNREIVSLAAPQIGLPEEVVNEVVEAVDELYKHRGI